MSIIHTKPLTSAGSHQERKLYQVPTGGSQIADSAAFADVISVKWLVSLRDIVSGATCAYEVMAVHNIETNDADYNIHNVVGTTLANNTVVQLMGGTHMIIQITNNNANTVELRISKHTLEL